MSETDFFQAIADYQNVISSIWQYWLATTFAFIVAFHAGRKSITKYLTMIGCLLYLMASLAAILRYVRIVAVVDQLNVRMTAAELEPVSVNPILSYGVPMMSFSTLILGTVVAIGFAIYQYRAQKGT